MSFKISVLSLFEIRFFSLKKNIHTVKFSDVKSTSFDKCLFPHKHFFYQDREPLLLSRFRTSPSTQKASLCLLTNPYAKGKSYIDFYYNRFVLPVLEI